MNEHHPQTGPDHGWYEIRLQGRLSSRWSTQFDGMTMTPLDDGTTVLGPVADQAALHGLLHRLGDLGLPLLSVRELPDQGDSPRTTSTVQGD